MVTECATQWLGLYSEILVHCLVLKPPMGFGLCEGLGGKWAGFELAKSGFGLKVGFWVGLGEKVGFEGFGGKWISRF